MFLVRTRVPYDVVFSLPRAEFIAHVVVMREYETGEPFDWPPSRG